MELEEQLKTPADFSVDFEHEVRLAVVMYGGVSLAIYMYGVAEELWRLVRATCPATPYSVANPPTELMSFDDEESTEPVYRKVAVAKDGGDDKTIRTRFVVDIVSGTSAGGINGVCLATALANNTPLTALENIWVEAGALDTLLNDERSVLEGGAPIENLVYEAPPRSLLNGRRMLAQLISGLREMSGPAEEVPSSPLVDELDLWVTATDLEGLELPIRLANVVTTERRHANRYHFRFFRQGSQESAEPNRNDFAMPSIDFLAYAARSSSAFPFAFEPIRLQTMPPLAEIGDWGPFYPDYAVDDDFAARPFSDGGILDNKPFTYATDELVRRRAALPVDRKLIYIEPDPAEPAEDGAGAAEPPKEWNAVETVIAALLTLPRVETIREDIHAVTDRSREIERLRAIVERAGAETERTARVHARLAAAANADWASKTLAQILEDDVAAWGTSYAPYHRLKVAGTIDHLARLVVRAARLKPESDDAWAARQIVEAWVATRYAEEPEPGAAQLSDNAFLIGYDLPFRRRRLAFVYGKLKGLQSDASSRILAAAGLPPELPGDDDPRRLFAELRLALSEAQAPLYRLEEDVAAPDGPIASAIGGTGVSGESLLYILEASSPEERALRLDQILSVGDVAFDAAAGAIASATAGALEEARNVVNDVLGPHFSDRVTEVPATLNETLRHALRYYYDSFESYDLVLFPLQYATALGETNPVEIVRISPADAPALVGSMPAANLALMGRGLKHFAAFLDETWRRHDMLVGRLHGAECLIRALAPAAVADGLVTEAHNRIFAEYAKEQTGTEQPNPRQWFEDTYKVRQIPEPPPIDTARRASPIVVTIVQDILKGQQSGAGGAAGTAWETLSHVLPDQPGGWAAVKAAGRVLLQVPLLRRVAIAAAAFLLLLLLGGAAFLGFGAGWWQVFGGALLLAGLVLVGGLLWAALAIVGAIRAFVAGEVNAFLGPYAAPAAPGS